MAGRQAGVLATRQDDDTVFAERISIRCRFVWDVVSMALPAPASFENGASTLHVRPAGARLNETVILRPPVLKVWSRTRLPFSNTKTISPCCHLVGLFSSALIFPLKAPT